MNLASLLTYKHFYHAYLKVSENNGAPGIDGISVQTFAKNVKAKLQKLIWEIQQGSYRCQPCKVVEIPKNKGSFRRLAIPTVRDRIVQTVLSQALTPFFEPHFERCSYGYRPERSYLQAVAQVEKYRDAGYTCVLDADIKGYFDHIPQPFLLRELRHYIECNALIALIENSLIQMQQHQKQCVYGAAMGLGVPQGSPLSPVLANMYLDSLDEALLEAEFKVVRFADDFIVLTQTANEVAHAWSLTQQHLEELALNFNLEKTRITDFDSGFVFLGHYFIGGLTQVLKSGTGQPILSQWQWDAPSSPYQQSPSAVEFEESVNHDSQSELQKAILDCQPEAAQTELASQHMSLSNHCQILYVAKQGAVIHKVAGKFEIKHSGEPIDSLPINHVDAIMTFGAIHTTRAVNIHCVSQHVPLLMMSQSGHFIGVIGAYPAIEHSIISAQFNAQSSSLNYAKTLVTAKVHNLIHIIRRKLRLCNPYQQCALTKVLKQLIQQTKHISHCTHLQSLLGIEGQCAKVHFLLLKSLLPTQFAFNSRNRRPPKDPFNALLSLGYSIIFNQVLAFCQARKLHIQLGHLHQNRQIPALALDMMEPFRFIADLVATNLLMSRALCIDDFEMRDQACLIGAKAKNLFIHSIEKQMQTEFEYPALGVTTDLRRCMDLQLTQYKQSLLDANTPFLPFRLKQ